MKTTIFSFACILAMVSACSSSDTTSGTGGAAGSAAGGTGGGGTGGSAGSATGGSAGSATGGSAGSATGGTGGTSAGSDCDQVCAIKASVTCAGYDPSTCVASCDSGKTMFPSCTAQYSAMLTCASGTSASDWECVDSSTNLKATVCAAEQTAFATCAGF